MMARDFLAPRGRWKREAAKRKKTSATMLPRRAAYPPDANAPVGGSGLTKEVQHIRRHQSEPAAAPRTDSAAR